MELWETVCRWSRETTAACAWPGRHARFARSADLAQGVGEPHVENGCLNAARTPFIPLRNGTSLPVRAATLCRKMRTFSSRQPISGLPYSARRTGGHATDINRSRDRRTAGALRGNCNRSTSITRPTMPRYEVFTGAAACSHPIASSAATNHAAPEVALFVERTRRPTALKLKMSRLRLERDEVISGRILHWRSSLSTRRVSSG